MRYINKGQEPKTVTDTRCAATTNLSRGTTARAAFNQIDKGEVRKRLAEEQGCLCAFCMTRINEASVDDRGEHTMKIAHRTPIAVNPGEALNWRNMLGCCDGWQRREGVPATCDCAQGSRVLEVDPTQQQSVQRLFYEHRAATEGLFITSEDAAVRSDVERTLALNAGDLPALREKVWNAFQELCRRRGPKGIYGRLAWRQYFPQWLKTQSDRGRLPPFLGVVEKKVGL